MLPKGKLKAGEDVRTAAEREVRQMSRCRISAATTASGKGFFAGRIWGWLRRLVRPRAGIARANS